MNRVRRCTLVAAATGCALAGAATPAGADNAQLIRAVARDTQYLHRDATALSDAGNGDSISALKLAGHRLGLGLSSFIKDITPLRTSTPAGHRAKVELLHGLRTERDGVQELNKGVKLAAAGQKSAAKRYVEMAIRDVASGELMLEKAAAIIKTL